jgi:hypothetical protein
LHAWVSAEQGAASFASAHSVSLLCCAVACALGVLTKTFPIGKFSVFLSNFPLKNPDRES